MSQRCIAWHLGTSLQQPHCCSEAADNMLCCKLLFQWQLSACRLSYKTENQLAARLVHCQAFRMVSVFYVHAFVESLSAVKSSHVQYLGHRAFQNLCVHFS